MTVFYVFEFIFWGLFIFFLRYLGTLLFMMNYLAIKNTPYSQGGHPSVTGLPLSQCTTPCWDVAGNGAPVPSTSFLHPEATSLSILSEVSWLSLRFHAVGWGGLGMGRWVCISAILFFPLGLAAVCTGHSGWNVASAPLQPAIEGSNPVPPLLPCPLMLGRWWEVREGQIHVSADLLFSWWWLLLHPATIPFNCVSTPITWLSHIYQPLKLEGCLCPSDPFWVAKWVLQSYPPLLPCQQVPLQVPDCVCCSHLSLCHILLLLLAQIQPPSDVSMCRSLRFICMLSRGSYVEL